MLVDTLLSFDVLSRYCCKCVLTVWCVRAILEKQYLSHKSKQRMCAVFRFKPFIQIKKGDFEAANKALEAYRVEKGLSKTKLAKEMKELGVCLGNFNEYGSASKLRKALRRNRRLIAPLKEVKKWPMLKSCLLWTTRKKS